MTDDEQIVAFIQNQLRWIQEQDLILAKIEGKLLAMKQLATYRLAHQMTFVQVQHVNEQMEMLQKEVQQLERELYKGIVN